MDNVLETILDDITELGYNDLCDIAEGSGITVTTLYNWMSYKVSSPRLVNIIAVAKYLGYEISIAKHKPKLRLVK